MLMRNLKEALKIGEFESARMMVIFIDFLIFSSHEKGHTNLPSITVLRLSPRDF